MTNAKPDFDFSGRRCRWIIGDVRSDARQCEASPQPAKPYCAAHMRQAYRPTRPDDARDPWDKVA
jgi:hypothetical protein